MLRTIRREIGAHLLDGKGLSMEAVRYADVPAFMILKAQAHRRERKHAADLILVVKYSGSVQEVAALFVERSRSEQHPEAVQDGLAALERSFWNDTHGEGYKKVGAVAHAHFYGEDDEDEFVGRQCFAAGLVQSVLTEIGRQRAI